MGATNTVVIYKLPKPLIKPLTETLGDPAPAGLVRWIQLRFMRRVLAVFDTAESATAALDVFKARMKDIEGCEEAQIGYSISNVESLAESHLQLPDPGRLLFVSPPPSPPNEWQETMEEEPNRQTHYEEDFNSQLVRALKASQEQNLASPTYSPVDPNAPESPRVVTIIEAQENKPALQVTAEDQEIESA